MATQQPISNETPRTSTGHRDPDHVVAINVRMGDNFVAMLDKLCDVNRRSRREIIEILVNEAHEELLDDEFARINPL